MRSEPLRERRRSAQSLRGQQLGACAVTVDELHQREPTTQSSASAVQLRGIEALHEYRVVRGSVAVVVELAKQEQRKVDAVTRVPRRVLDLGVDADTPPGGAVQA